MPDRPYLNRARAFATESKRRRRESALTIMFTATSLWQSLSSMRAAQSALDSVRVVKSVSSGRGKTENQTQGHGVAPGVGPALGGNRCCVSHHHGEAGSPEGSPG